MMKTEVMKLNTITIFPANIVRKMFNFRSFICVDSLCCVTRVYVCVCVADKLDKLEKFNWHMAERIDKNNNKKNKKMMMMVDCV